MKKLLIISLAINVVAIAALGSQLARANFRRNLSVRLGLSKRPAEDKAAFYDDRRELHRRLGGNGGTVFAGDSIVASIPVAEAFGWRNRGIGSETTADLIKRLPELLCEKPERMVLQVGTNDIAREWPDKLTLENYGSIFGQCRGIRLIVLSILPRSRNAERVKPLNSALAAMCKESGVEFIDVQSAFDRNGDGRIDADCTVDGTHLNAEGQWRMLEQLRQHLKQ